MASKDAWEEILELARRIDDGVAARRGVDPGEAMDLARSVMAFQHRLSGGPSLAPPTPVAPPAHDEQAADEQTGGSGGLA
jgi:hypothetical protein